MAGIEIETEWSRHIRVIPQMDRRVLLSVSELDGSGGAIASLNRGEAKTLAKALDPDRGGDPEAKVREAERERDEWKARADKWHGAWQKSAPNRTVTREDVEKAVRRGHNMLNAEVGVVNEMCDLLGVESGQAADPVEALAEELYDADHEDDFAYTLWKHSILKDDKDRYRRMARRVIERKDEDR